MMSTPSCLIVMYHYVGSYEKYPGIHGISVSTFADQIDALCEAMEPIDWPTLYAWTQGQGSIPDRCFLLTFDDGLLDHIRVADVLVSRGLRGTFLVPGAVLGGNGLLYAHIIHLLLSRAKPAELESVILDGQRPVPDLASRSAAMYHYEEPTTARVKYLLTVGLPSLVRDGLLRNLANCYIGDLEDFAAQWYMNVTDLRRMQAAGHTIGGHGFSHEPYGNMTVVERMDDMHKSRAVLSGALGDDSPLPRPFSYPYGQCPEGTPIVCKRAGFSTAFTTEKRWADDTCGPYRLPRVDAMYLETNNDAGFTVEPKATDDTVPAMPGVRED